MLSYNVADLLRSAPGTTRELPLALDQLAIDTELAVAAPIRGTVRLANTGRGIVAKGHLTTALPETCSRCLTATVAPVDVEFMEEALPSVDLESGTPIAHADETETLFLDDHHELDLTGTVRDAISLAEPIVALCRPDCRGLCLECGIDLNDRSCPYPRRGRHRSAPGGAARDPAAARPAGLTGTVPHRRDRPVTGTTTDHHPEGVRTWESPSDACRTRDRAITAPTTR